MADKPIIFSAPMVRALLDGRKTQTRRLLGPGNTLFNGRPWTKLHKAQVWAWEDAWVDPGPSPAGNPGPYLKLPWASGHEAFEDTVHRIYPAIQPGNRLYVREGLKRQETDQGIGYMTYAADGAKVWPLTEWRKDRHSIPSIHMPRWASRLTLTVTDVRVQRLQDISEADAMAEGSFLGRCSCREMQRRETKPIHAAFRQTWCATHGDEFSALWNSLHGPDAWNANPWVVALTFKVQRWNIYAMEASK